MNDYAKGQSIFAQGDAGDSIFLIERGLVKICALDGSGRSAIVALLTPDVFCGETCLVERPPSRNTSAIALVDCRLIRWDRKSFVRRLGIDQAFAATVISHLAARASCVEEDRIDLMMNSSEKRLARLLLTLADADEHRSVVKISQEVLAEIVGTTRSRVCFFMNRFRREGLIDYNGRQLIVHTSLQSVLSPTIRTVARLHS